MTIYDNQPRVPQSADRSGRNDRLVKRFVTGGRLHIHLRLGGDPTTHGQPIIAEVSNLSITGALATVAGSLPVRPGAMVTLGDGTSTAVCRVIHGHMEPGAKTQTLGLEIIDPTDDFRRELSLAVGALRKDRGQVREAWEHGR